MSENKKFKEFRTQLNENEYSEVLTGYPNRSVAPCGAIKFDADMMNRANAMLNAISRSTFMHPNEAFIRIKTRLNLMMLDFPWTPYLWSDAGTGNVTVTVTRYGRVDGVDALTGAIRMDGKANSPDGFMEFILSVGIDIGEDGLYRVTPQLSRKEDVVVEEGVEVKEEAEQIDEAGERRLKRLMGASYKAYIKRDDKKHSKMANLAGKLTHKIERNQARRAGASPEVAGQANPLDMKKGRVTRASNKRYSKKVAAVRKFRNRASTMRAAATAAMSEELVGKQHKLDVNKNKRLDSQDFAALRAKKKAVKESQETPKIAAGKKRLAAAILAQKKEDEQKKKRENDFVRKFSAFAKRMNRSTGYKPTTMQKENYPEFSGGIPLMVPNPTDNIADQSNKGKKKIIRKNTK